MHFGLLSNLPEIDTLSRKSEYSFPSLLLNEKSLQVHCPSVL